MKIALGKLQTLGLHAPLTLQWDGGYVNTPTASCLSLHSPLEMTYR